MDVNVKERETNTEYVYVLGHCTKCGNKNGKKKRVYCLRPKNWGTLSSDQRKRYQVPLGENAFCREHKTSLYDFNNRFYSKIPFTERLRSYMKLCGEFDFSHDAEKREPILYAKWDSKHEDA